MAKPGYALGAIRVYAEPKITAIQLVFMRADANGRLEPNVSYTSKVLGIPSAGGPQEVRRAGEQFVGFVVRRSVAADGIGLVREHALRVSRP